MGRPSSRRGSELLHEHRFHDQAKHSLQRGKYRHCDVEIQRDAGQIADQRELDQNEINHIRREDDERARTPDLFSSVIVRRSYNGYNGLNLRVPNDRWVVMTPLLFREPDVPLRRIAKECEVAICSRTEEQRQSSAMADPPAQGVGQVPARKGSSPDASLGHSGGYYTSKAVVAITVPPRVVWVRPAVNCEGTYRASAVSPRSFFEMHDRPSG